MEYIRESACSSSVVTLYPNARTVWEANTGAAHCLIAEVPGFGRSLFIDGEIQSSEYDEDMYHETLVHPVMAAAKERGRVLVIGGGEGATVREVLKWPDVVSVDWVDIDGELVEACKEHLGWAAFNRDDPRVRFWGQDIRTFFAGTQTLYDVILIDLTDPDPEDDPASEECLMNYTFWEQVRRHLAEGGVWATHTGPVCRPGVPSGATFLDRAAAAVAGIADIANTIDYHVPIKSFQDDWGFRMSCRQTRKAELPTWLPVRFLVPNAYDAIFRWCW